MPRERSRSRDRPSSSSLHVADDAGYSREQVLAILRWLEETVRELENCRYSLSVALRVSNDVPQILVDVCVERVEHIIQADIRDLVENLR
jgi:hypothetical protein